MKRKLFDRDGYPTERALLDVAYYNTCDDIEGFLNLIQDLWYYPHRYRRKGNKLYLSTGGWSGNESIIDAMKENFFWRIAHTQWKSGGHYWFNIRAYKK